MSDTGSPAPIPPGELTVADVDQLAPEAAQPPGVTIGAAVAALKAGRRVTRAGWNGRGMWLKLFVPDRDSDMTVPYVFMSTVTGQLVPWLASQTDLLAEDWQEVS